MTAQHARRSALGALAAITLAAAVPVAAAADVRTVRPGETLSRIAADHGLEVEALAARNNLSDPHHLLAGTTLRLDGVGGVGASPQGPTHTVQAGETLSELARAAGTSVAALQRLNRLGDPDRVYVGQRLQLPARNRAATSAPRTATTPGPAPRTTPRPTPLPAPAPRGTHSAEEIERVLTATARRYGWNPAYVKAIAWQESGWQMDVVSSADAIGVMQVLPTTAVEMSEAFKLGRTLDPHVLEDNVLAGVLLLEMLDDLTGGDVRLITASYFQGLGNIRRDGMLDYTKRYVDNVLALRDRFAG